MTNRHSQLSRVMYSLWYFIRGQPVQWLLDTERGKHWNVALLAILFYFFLKASISHFKKKNVTTIMAIIITSTSVTDCKVICLSWHLWKEREKKTLANVVVVAAQNGQNSEISCASSLAQTASDQHIKSNKEASLWQWPSKHTKILILAGLLKW